MSANTVELINVSQDVAWLPWAVQYFFLIGLSYGAFFLTLPGFAFRKKGFEKLARLALPVAISCAIVAPVALVSDLHQPFRFYHFYLYFTPTSWMSWGSFFLPLYVLGLLVYGWLVYRPALAERSAGGSGVMAAAARVLAAGGGEAPGLVRILGVATAIFAVLVALYTGSEVAVVQARVLWYTPLLPLLYITTAFGGAAGLCLLLNRVVGDGDVGVSRHLNRLVAQFQGLTLVLLVTWALSGIGDLSASGMAVIRLATAYDPVTFLVSWVLLGTLVPLFLAWRNVADPVWPVGALALFGAWTFRWIVFIDGQCYPKTAAGFFDYHLPLGHEGLLGMAGTLGLWLFLMLALAALVPWYSVGRGNR